MRQRVFSLSAFFANLVFGAFGDVVLLLFLYIQSCPLYRATHLGFI